MTVMRKTRSVFVVAVAALAASSGTDALRMEMDSAIPPVLRSGSQSADEAELEATWQEDRRFERIMPAEHVQQKVNGWQTAVTKV